MFVEAASTQESLFSDPSVVFFGVPHAREPELVPRPELMRGRVLRSFGSVFTNAGRLPQHVRDLCWLCSCMASCASLLVCCELTVRAELSSNVSDCAGDRGKHRGATVSTLLSLHWCRGG